MEIKRKLGDVEVPTHIKIANGYKVRQENNPTESIKAVNKIDAKTERVEGVNRKDEGKLLKDIDLSKTAIELLMDGYMSSQEALKGRKSAVNTGNGIPLKIEAEVEGGVE